MSVTTAAAILRPVLINKEMAKGITQKEVSGNATKEAVKCAICGKTLRDPKSITRGIGPICWGKEQIRLAVTMEDDTGNENVGKEEAEGIATIKPA